MKHGTGSRRQHRNRGSNGRRGHHHQPQRTQVYDSNGPDVRIRGTAHQVAEKYLALAKDSHSAGDRIMAENYYQHAEHYIRIINEMNGTFDMSRVAGGREENMGNEAGSEQIPASNTVSAVTVSTVQRNRTEDLGLPSSILGTASVASRETEIAE